MAQKAAEDPDLRCGSGRHCKVLRKLSKVDPEPLLGVLEAALGPKQERGFLSLSAPTGELTLLVSVLMSGLLQAQLVHFVTLVAEPA